MGWVCGKVEEKGNNACRILTETYWEKPTWKTEKEMVGQQ
jgi:hypothetical protein